MVYLTSLWLPILLSAVIVFVASSIIHMVLQLHKSEYKMLPGESNILAAMHKEGVPPGEYMFPSAPTMKEMRTPDMIEKFKKGPCGIMTVRGTGVPSMGKPLTLWFLYGVLMSVFAAYIAGRTLGPGTDYLLVFRVTGTVATLGYAGAQLQRSIWSAAPWRTTLSHVFDGLIYGLLTGGVFGWLWP